MPARINTITLNSGDIITASKNLTVLVGPNNVGKSVLLSGVNGKFEQRPGSLPFVSQVVDSVDLVLPPEAELRQKLETSGQLRPAGSYQQGIYSEEHYFVPVSNVILTNNMIEQIYTADIAHVSSFSHVSQLLAVLMQPESRLGQLGQNPAPNLLVEEPQTPLQMLYKDRILENRLSKYAQQAFSIDLTVNRHAGSQVSLHVGKAQAAEPRAGDLTDYQRQLASLPQASEQGHGVQAFLGILMTLVTRAYDIVLIDEPEAFLHPPQAKLLGEIFVELSKQGTQVLVSTHSDDFLQGVLTASASAADVTVARLTRPTPGSNSIAQVPPESVKALFDDALLRYSNILNGIFYKGVVLCESQSDCKYYSAVLDEMFSSDESGAARPDLLFTQCGGKDRFAKASSALRATKVPTAIVADIDLLNDQAKFSELFTQLGGDFTSIEGKYKDVVAAVKTKAAAPDRAFTKSQVDQIFDGSNDNKLKIDESRSIRELTKVTTGWDKLKKSGVAVLPSGQPTKSFNEIIDQCKKVGLFVLTVGELERFHPEITTNKQKWLREVFEQGLYRNSPEAAKLLEDVSNFIAQQQ